MNTSLLYELRVLDGSQRGATFPMRPGVPLCIGQDWSSDVVLRGEDHAAARLALLPDESALELEVGCGRSEVEDVRVDAGQKMNVGLYVPFTLGDARLAVGRVGASQWGTLFGEAPVQDDPQSEEAASSAASVSAALPATTAAVASEASTRNTGWVKRLLLGGATLMTISAGALTLAWAMEHGSLSAGQQMEQMRQTLRHLGYSSLAVERLDGQLTITGYLDTQAQRAQLEQALAGTRFSHVRVKPWINEQVAQGVAEVYRLNGVAAQVKTTGPGIVQAQTRESNTEALERAQAVARRDVPGLHKLVALNDAPPAPSKTPAVAADPGKRVAAIVPGDPAYVVTADGTRYFPGAVLPTGHRIQAILPNLVQLEREGQMSELTF
ncbi:hypothetical protein EII20_03025 [Comamonadaceae bacterium OH2545_COT-014]|nr:hypothetical protein EII20_03025 [Comamonadaceae bacterium OH2545_COT-014]